MSLSKEEEKWQKLFIKNDINSQIKTVDSLKSVLDIYMTIGNKFQFYHTNNIQGSIQNILYCCELVNGNNVRK